MMQYLPRQEIIDIFQSALKAVDAYGIIEGHVGQVLQTYRDGNFERLLVISFGKAACPMTQALVDRTGGLPMQGILITKEGHILRDNFPDRIALHEAGHPVPDIRGVRATQQVVAALKEADEKTLVACLISGGGSALLVSPLVGIALEQKQEITRILLGAGADIGELNAVRKHLSLVKGGRLAELAHPARVISLILSDVIGDPLDVIASGPTSPDQTTYANALMVIQRYGLADRMPAEALNVLVRGERGEIPETPKEGNPVFRNVENLIVGSNRKAIEMAGVKAADLGYSVVVLSSELQGEAREIGTRLAQEALRRQTNDKRICLIAGGETTVTVKGSGLGGRNMELALSSALELKGNAGITLLSGGTDGTDGPTDAAGAIVDGETITEAIRKGLDPEDYLHRNDSYSFFKAAGGLLITGPTGTNVMDLQIILIG